MKVVARSSRRGRHRPVVTPFLRRDAGVRRLRYIHSSGPAVPRARRTVDDNADLDFVREVRT